MSRHMRRRWVLGLAPLALVVFVGLGGWVVQQLWNWLLPTLFAWPALTFWQALGLLALCRILFGGGGWSRGGWRGRMAGRWDTMTPEERARVRQRMRTRWGMGPAGDAPGS